MIGWLRHLWRTWRTWTTYRCPMCGATVAANGFVTHVEWHARRTPRMHREWVEASRR